MENNLKEEPTQDAVGKNENISAESVAESSDGQSAERAEKNETANPTKMKKFLQFLIFTGFSISAGVIQFVTTGALSTWTGWIPYYWVAYLIGLVLSVVWNFTFNRKFTFKAANNVPLAMGLVVIYYCAFTPLSTFGADAIVDAWKSAAGSGWNDAFEMVITAGMMILNFLTEFVWDKFVVFNQKVTNKILGLFKKKRRQEATAEATALTAEAEENAPCAQVEEPENNRGPESEEQAETQASPPPGEQEEQDD